VDSSPSTSDLFGINAENDLSNSDPNEPRYCTCNQVSYGDMVACDKQDVRIPFYICLKNSYRMNRPRKDQKSILYILK